MGRGVLVVVHSKGGGRGAGREGMSTDVDLELLFTLWRSVCIFLCGQGKRSQPWKAPLAVPSAQFDGGETEGEG